MTKSQIICFTHAGGNKSFFDEIETDLKDFKIEKMEYSGHGERHKEEFYKNFDELADDIFKELQTRIVGDYALFGYSMGAITLVEVLKRIISSGMSVPHHVFLAAHEPHTKSELLGFTDDELDEWVKDRTIRFGTIPEELLNNRVFWRTYLPIYRADYTIIGKYEFDKLDLKTSVPATVFYSETDTPFEDMKQWNRFFVKECDFYQYSGTHFFIRDYHAEIAQVIKNKLNGSK